METKTIRGGQIEIECAFCGTTFLRKRSEVERNKRRGRLNMCSSQCRANWIRENMSGEKSPHFGSVKVECSICGKKILRKPSTLTLFEHHYCSKKCQYEGQSKFLAGKDNPIWKSVEVECAWCGRKLTRQPNQVKRAKRWFCDAQCAANWKSEAYGGSGNPTWRGGHTNYYGPNWKRQARRARARDGHKCQECGTTEKELERALDVHHIVRFADFDGDWKKANLLTNLTSLCHSCHMLIENGTEAVLSQQPR